MLNIFFYGGSILLGLVLGAVFVALWQLCMPPGTTRRMIGDLVAVAGAMTRSDEVSEFLALYKRLFVSVGGYLIRNIGGLLLACVPIALVLILLAPAALESWGRRAATVAIYPPSIAATEMAGVADEIEPRSSVTIGGMVVPIDDPGDRTAVCWDWAYCLLFESLGFEVIEFADPGMPDVSFVVVRPELGDGNPARPVLSDLEFAFFVAFFVGTLGAFAVRRVRR